MMFFKILLILTFSFTVQAESFSEKELASKMAGQEFNDNDLTRAPQAECNERKVSSLPRYRVSCDKVQNILDDINEQVSEDKQIYLDCLDERYKDGWLFGLGKTLEHSQMSLDSNRQLCSNPRGGDFKDTKLNDDVHVGIGEHNIERLHDIFIDHGIKLKFETRSSNMGTMYVITGLNYPVCE